MRTITEPSETTQGEEESAPPQEIDSGPVPGESRSKRDAPRREVMGDANSAVMIRNNTIVYNTVIDRCAAICIVTGKTDPSDIRHPNMAHQPLVSYRWTLSHSGLEIEPTDILPIGILRTVVVRVDILGITWTNKHCRQYK